MRSEVDARKIGVEDQLQLTITVEGSGAPTRTSPLPRPQNLQVVGGPSQSTQVSLVNGAHVAVAELHLGRCSRGRWARPRSGRRA